MTASFSKSRSATSCPAKPLEESFGWNRTRSSTKTTSSTSSSLSSRSRAGSGSPRPTSTSGTPLLGRRTWQRRRAISPSVVWPSDRSRIAVGGTPRSSVRTLRMPSPSRLWAPAGLDLLDLVQGGGDVLGLVDLGQGTGGGRDGVDPHAMLLLELAEDLAVVLHQPPLARRPGDRPAAGRRGRPASRRRPSRPGRRTGRRRPGSPSRRSSRRSRAGPSARSSAPPRRA